MITEITSALTSLKAAADIIKGFNSLKVDVAVKEKSSELLGLIISLQSHILSIQSEYGELLDFKGRIEKELMDLKSFLIDKKNYVLVEIAPGILAYSLNSEIKTNEPEHYLCQNCFDTKNQKSILQRKYADHKDLICNSCKSTFRLSDENNSRRQITIRP